MKPFEHYFAMFIAFFLAVVFGNLTASGIQAWVIFSGLSVAMEDFSDGSQKQLEFVNQINKTTQQENLKKLQIQREQKRIHTENSRKKTTVGKSLSRQCNEWTYADNANSNDYASQEKYKYCNAYQNYIKNGIFPDFENY